jgi:hypothetical protein
MEDLSDHNEHNLTQPNERVSQVDEAEKVEESLRDFIGKIIAYYEKFNINNTLLLKYEKKISKAETLLEVFDVMKEMFEELMNYVVKNSLCAK